MCISVSVCVCTRLRVNAFTCVRAWLPAPAPALATVWSTLASEVLASACASADTGVRACGAGITPSPASTPAPTHAPTATATATPAVRATAVTAVAAATSVAIVGAAFPRVTVIEPASAAAFTASRAPESHG
jgi:hypothetical protein